MAPNGFVRGGLDSSPSLLLNSDCFWTDLASNATHMSPGARPSARQACTSDLRLNSRDTRSWWEKRGFGGTAWGAHSDQISVAPYAARRQWFRAMVGDSKKISTAEFKAQRFNMSDFNQNKWL